MYEDATSLAKDERTWSKKDVRCTGAQWDEFPHLISTRLQWLGLVPSRSFVAVVLSLSVSIAQCETPRRGRQPGLLEPPLLLTET